MAVPVRFRLEVRDEIKNMNKSTVWAFGDSFSEEVINLPNSSERVQYIKKYLNGVPYKTWIKIVAEKIGFEYRNYAATNGINFEMLGCGNSNDQIFYNVTELSNQFKKGDLVFIGFTDICRYEIFDYNNNAPSSVLLGHTFGDKTKFYHTHFVDRNHKYYVHEILQRFKILETLSEIIGFKIFYWDWSNSLIETEPNVNPKNWIVYELFNKWVTFSDIFNIMGKENCDIKCETGGEINDNHWGKHNNNILGDLFYNHIKSIL